jgi:dynactin 1
VQKLKDENDLLQKNLEIESTKSIPGLTEALDFKKIFESSKAQTTAIDLELRRLEVKEAKLHVQYLNAFMPEGFIKRGGKAASRIKFYEMDTKSICFISGDHDSLLVLLLVPRLIGKVELLLSQVNEKLIPPSLVDGINSYLSGPSQDAISSSTDIERYAFACQFSFLLHSLQSELHRWSSSLNTCSTDAFLKVGLLHPDLGVQERAVDFYLELLRKSQVSIMPIKRNLFSFS